MGPLDFFEMLEATSLPRYNVGDEVCSKFTGLPGVAKVMAVMPAVNYLNMTGTLPEKYNTWNSKFEGWVQEPVYLVLFPELRRATSFEEFMSGLTEEQIGWYKDGALEEVYKLSVGQTRFVAYPEQDLELFQ